MDLASPSFFSNVMQTTRLNAAMLQPVLRGLRGRIYVPGGLISRRLPLINHKYLYHGAVPPITCFRGFATQTQSTQAVQLRDYQLECIQSVVSALKNGHKRVGISLATGGGKTVGYAPFPSLSCALITTIPQNAILLVEISPRA